MKLGYKIPHDVSNRCIWNHVSWFQNSTLFKLTCIYCPNWIEEMKARTNNFIRSFTYFYFYRIHFVKLRYLFLIISRIIRWSTKLLFVRMMLLSYYNCSLAMSITRNKCNDDEKEKERKKRKEKKKIFIYIKKPSNHDPRINVSNCSH